MRSLLYAKKENGATQVATLVNRRPAVRKTKQLDKDSHRMSGISFAIGKLFAINYPAGKADPAHLFSI